ncbi:MAG: co-chaperone GroES, partial [Chloroflexota bacterium]
PDTAKEKPTQGEVIAVGPGRVTDKGERIPMEIKVGDQVIYGKYSGTTYTHEGDEYVIIKASDVLAKLG